MKKKLPEHLTKGGPGDKFLGGGSVDTSSWSIDPDIKITSESLRVFEQLLFNSYIQMLKVNMVHVLGLNKNTLTQISEMFQ